MKICRKCFMGKSIRNSQRIMNHLLNNKKVNNIYCICMDESSDNLAFIINSQELLKNIYKNADYTVVGIAKGRVEALDLFLLMMCSFVSKQNNFNNFKNYFLNEVSQ